MVSVYQVALAILGGTLALYRTPAWERAHGIPPYVLSQEAYLCYFRRRQRLFRSGIWACASLCLVGVVGSLWCWYHGQSWLIIVFVTTSVLAASVCLVLLKLKQREGSSEPVARNIEILKAFTETFNIVEVALDISLERVILDGTLNDSHGGAFNMLVRAIESRLRILARENQESFIIVLRACQELAFTDRAPEYFLTP